MLASQNILLYNSWLINIFWCIVTVNQLQEVLAKLPPDTVVVIGPEADQKFARPITGFHLTQMLEVPFKDVTKYTKEWREESITGERYPKNVVALV